MNEDIIVKTYFDKDKRQTYVDHGIGAVTLRKIVLPPEPFYAGWGGARFSQDINEWVIYADPMARR